MSDFGSECSVLSVKWIIFSSNTAHIRVGWWLLECIKVFCQVLNKRGYGLIICLKPKVNAVYLSSECAPSNPNCVTASLGLF